MSSGEDLGFGGLVLLGLLAVPALWTAPVASALSYVPSLGFAVFRRQRRMRGIGQFIVFLPVWAVFSGLVVVMWLMTESGPFRPESAELPRLSQWVAPAIFMVVQVGVSEFFFRRMSSHLDLGGTPDVPPPDKGALLTAGVFAALAVATPALIYVVVMVVLA